MLTVPVNTEDNTLKEANNNLCPNVPADVPEELKPFYVGNIYFNNYLDTLDDVNIYIYKNLPDTTDFTKFSCIEFTEYNSYYIRKAWYIKHCLTIGNRFAELYNNL